MEFIKEESEDMKIEEVFSLKQEETEEQTKMVFIREESENIKIEEVFRVKQEETTTKMEFIKEESENMKIEEVFSIKQETEEQTDLMSLKEETEVLKEIEDNHHDFITGERSCRCSQTENASSRKMTQKTRSPLICQQCGNRRSQKETLITHTEIYIEKLYTCPRCGKSFNRKGHLEDHMRVHTGERPFTCQQCGKSFTRKGSLKRHLSVHTEEKPYTCPQCGKSFIQRGHFKDHWRIHSGEKWKDFQR